MTWYQIWSAVFKELSKIGKWNLSEISNFFGSLALIFQQVLVYMYLYLLLIHGTYGEQIQESAFIPPPYNISLIKKMSITSAVLVSFDIRRGNLLSCSVEGGFSYVKLKY